MKSVLLVFFLVATSNALLSKKLLKRFYNLEGEKPLTQLKDSVITGDWYNSLGSELHISRQEPDGSFFGAFRTGKERYEGAAGRGHSRVEGRISGNMLTFHVFWKGGASVTTWNGHFFKSCSSADEESLKLTWTLVSALDHNACDEHWGANRMGQDTFTRGETMSGPRRAEKLY